MADSVKGTELPVKTTALANDKIIIVGTNTDPMVTSTISVSNLLGNTNVAISANVLVLREKTTPANATITIQEGRVFFDNNYIYVAIANNTLKRVAISTF